MADGRRIAGHLRGGGGVLMFPAGRVARRTADGRIEDGPWPSALGRLVYRWKATTVPVRVEGGNSRLFYAVQGVSVHLSRLLLMREQLKKRGREIRLRVGAPIDGGSFGPATPEQITRRLRCGVDALTVQATPTDRAG